MAKIERLLILMKNVPFRNKKVLIEEILSLTDEEKKELIRLINEKTTNNSKRKTALFDIATKKIIKTHRGKVYLAKYKDKWYIRKADSPKFFTKNTTFMQVVASYEFGWTDPYEKPQGYVTFDIFEEYFNKAKKLQRIYKDMISEFEKMKEVTNNE